MSMWQALDVMVVTLLVLMCVVYALYTLGGVRFKRRCLTLLVRCFGVRVFSVLSPRLSGCDHCSAGRRSLDFLDKPKP